MEKVEKTNDGNQIVRDLADAALDMSRDVMKFKHDYDWHKPTIEVYEGFIESSFRYSQILRRVPESSADEWRMYADQGDIILVFTYYYLTEE